LTRLALAHTGRGAYLDGFVSNPPTALEIGMQRTALWLSFLVTLASFAWLGCEPSRDSYKLAVVFTSDCKGYIEDCG
jgi:hypothetical protein